LALSSLVQLHEYNKLTWGGYMGSYIGDCCNSLTSYGHSNHETPYNSCNNWII
jgi:hypothetical protein